VTIAVPQFHLSVDFLSTDSGALSVLGQCGDKTNAYLAIGDGSNSMGFSPPKFVRSASELISFGI